MKALTLTQPWATLVAIGAKRIETRSWGTRYRGPVAIHAAKGLSSVGGMWGLCRLCADDPFELVLTKAGIDTRDLPLGAVLAIARLVDCVQIKEHHDPVALPRFIQHAAEYEQHFGDYRLGRWMWLLNDVEPLGTPVLARGALGLWDFGSAKPS